jgi:hypothetical protein
MGPENNGVAPRARRPLASAIRPAVVWTRCVGRVGVVRDYNLDIVLISTA